MFSFMKQKPGQFLICLPDNCPKRREYKAHFKTTYAYRHAIQTIVGS